MQFNLKRYQAEFVFSPYSFPCAVMGWGTGKTLSLIYRAMLYSQEIPENLGVIFRKEYVDLRDCFDEGTEILTKDGWKFFDELTYKDKVLSLNPKTEIAEYKNITKIICQDYAGEMFYHKNRSIEFCITPNHKLLTKHPTSKNKCKAKTERWKLEKIKDIKVKQFYLKKDFKWKGKEKKEIEIIPKKQLPNNAKRYIFKMDDWLEFLGWFVSEGNTYLHKTKKTWWISITQKKQENVKEIKDLLSRMGLPNTYYSNEKFIIGSRAISEHLNKYCGIGAVNKKVPNYVKNLSPRQIKIFLKAYNKGDGYITKTGERRFNTCSKKLADDIQELILKSGKYATINIRDNRGRKQWIKDHWATTRQLDYLIIEKRNVDKGCDSRIEARNIQKIKYFGKIYCVTVEPYHTIYVRKNGRCFWSGNSTIRDYEKYTGLKVNSQRNVVLPNGSIIMFRHLEELNSANIQNINLGWFGIEQADELESDEEFYTLWGRLRRDVKLSPLMQQLKMPKHTGFIIANAGRDWITEQWVVDANTVEKLKQGYHCIQATTYDNKENLPPEFLQKIELLKEKKPEIYRRFVLNHHDVNVDSFILIPKEWIKRLNGEGLYRKYIKKIISIDPSEGGDECVLKVFENEKVVDGIALKGERDPLKIVGHATLFASKHNVRHVVVDATGLGSPIASRLNELGLKVFPLKYGSSASDKDRWLNLKAEMYDYVAKKIQSGEVWPLDPQKEAKTIQDLTTIHYDILNSGGKIKIESKKDYRRRMEKMGKKNCSPDHGDCYVQGIFALQLILGKDSEPASPHWERVRKDIYRERMEQLGEAVYAPIDEEEYEYV